MEKAKKVRTHQSGKERKQRISAAGVMERVCWARTCAFSQIRSRTLSQQGMADKGRQTKFGTFLCDKTMEFAMTK